MCVAQVTGNVLVEQIDDFMAHGVDGVVGKPVDVMKILQMLATGALVGCTAIDLTLQLVVDSPPCTTS